MEPQRMAIIAQKRKTLKCQITSLRNAVGEGTITATNAKLRLARLETLFNNYEELHDELDIAEPENEDLARFDEIRDNFYEIAARVQDMSTTAAPPDLEHSNVVAHSTIIERQQSVRLPVVELPKFDGDYNKWLSFKNTFNSMIDSRTDIDDLNKFLYLKNSLTGAAATKLARYDDSAANYKKAKDTLIEAYEKKRVLITKHIDALIDIQPIKDATCDGLSKLIDDARQHLNMLDSLELKADEAFYAMLIRWLERALPAKVRRDWEKTLSLDTLPTWDGFCKFITEYAFRLATSEPESTRNKGENSNKRIGGQFQRPNKFSKGNTGARSFVTSASNPISNCVQCQQAHPLFKCPEFGKLSVSQRWNVVKTHKLCQNCLRLHQGPCQSTHCKHCPKFHNSLLHSERNFRGGKGKIESNQSTPA